MPRWDTQFQCGNVREAVGSRTGYMPNPDARIRGRTKKEVAESMLAMPFSGPFYVQRALLLMTNFGSAKTAKEQGILELSEVCILGDGAEPLPHPFLSEAVGFEVAEGLQGRDLQNLAPAERERWRAVALARGIPLIPAFKKNQQGDWKKFAECFGDVLCEGRKCLGYLAGLKPLSPTPSSGWRPQPQPPARGGGGQKRKRGASAKY